MERKKELKIAAILSNTARYTLLVLAILVFILALFSGSEEFGGGINGIIKNSPNALPWLLLFVVIFVAWKWELTGGIILIIIGLAMLYVFNFPAPNFLSTVSVLAILIILFGAFLILSWFLRLDKRQNEYSENV